MILSIDQGTTNSKAVWSTRPGRSSGTAPLRWVWRHRIPGGSSRMPRRSGRACWPPWPPVAASTPDATLAGVTISNQRESVVAWRRSTGDPLGPVIGWQDRRTASWCTRLATEDADDLVRARTGLRIDAMFSAPKIRWLLDQLPGVAEVGRLPGHRRRLAGLAADRRSTPTPCEAGNASRTLLYDVRGPELVAGAVRPLRCAGRDASRRCSRRTGRSGRPATCPDYRTAYPILAVLADSHAALYGQGCTTVGTAQGDVRHRLVGDDADRDLPGRPHRGAVDAGLADRSAHLRPGGQHPLLRGHALLDGHDPRTLRGRRARGPGRRRTRQRRRGPGPRVRRPRRSPLGPRRQGGSVGDDDLDHAGPSGSGGPGLGGPPDLRRRRGDRRGPADQGRCGPTAVRPRRRC